MFSKSDTTSWSYKIYEITDIINVTTPTYHIHNLPERYKEALLKNTELTMKKYKDVMKNLNLKWIEHSLAI